MVQPDELCNSYRVIARALGERGFTCGSYIFSTKRPVVLSVLSRPDCSESTFGLAAKDSVAAAAGESLCEAVQARLALQWRDQPVMEPLDFARISAGWQLGGAKVRHLQRYSQRSIALEEPGRIDSWADLAVSRFDHEPIVVDWPAAYSGRAARVLCPGANVYRRTDECAPFPVR